MDLEIRRLTYADLPQVVAIERRAFPAPWSLAMFVLELSRPGGVCLVAVDRAAGAAGDEIVGYCICSRHDTVWHLMDIAVDPAVRRRGHRPAAHPRPARRPPGAGRARDAGGPALQPRGDRPL